MAVKQVAIKVAGITISFVANDGLAFNPIEYRGFAINNLIGKPDMHIDVVKAITTIHDESDKVNSFVGDCRNTDMPDYRWETGVSKDEKEYIVIDFFNNQTYEWLKLTFSDDNGILQLKMKNTSQDVVDPYIFPLLNIFISRLLRRRNSFLIHSSVVNDNGNGYLFTAVSGTGKSTMARIWEQSGATIINDDMLALVPVNDYIEANNIPMPYYISQPRKVNLKGIFLISQSKYNFINRVTGATAILRLTSNTIQQPSTKRAAIEHLKLVEKVANIVPIFELGFKPDKDIVADIRKLNLQ